MKELNTVLVIMTDKHLGNFVASIPAIKALKHFYRDKRFYLAVDNSYKEIAEAICRNDNLILYPREGLRRCSAIKRAGIFFKFICQSRRVSPDLIIDLEARHISSTVAFLTGAPLRIGSSTATRSWCYNRKVDLSKEEEHKVYKYLQISSAAGASYENPYANLKASDAHVRSVKNKLSSMLISENKPIICIHPGAGKKFKEWTSEGFIEISDWLSSEGLQVVFIGGNRDLPKIYEIIAGLKSHAYNMGGMLSLGELIALLEISSLYIGNDTGPLHIASAVGTIPAIGLFFHPGAHKRWFPFTKDSTVLRGDVGCRECKGNHCLTFECTKKLTPSEVKSALEKIIDRTLIMR
ncbi:MAG: glycosyltransferase family 9 protein [Nitrospiraceae bacterium]|nr:MAG: glycosyltransferase family 9 protein [Nitrospiraceae bacterium]